MKIGPAVRLTRTCPQLPQAAQLGVWCSLVGHWATAAHGLDSRVLHESVLLYCVAGGGWFSQGGVKHDVHPGDLFCCLEGEDHGYGCDRGGWEIHWVHFGGTQSVPLLAQAGFTAADPIHAVGRDTPLIAAFNRLLDCLGRNNPTAAWDASGHLYWLLLTLIKSRVRTGRDLTALIPDDCECLDDLVAQSGYSKYHYCRLFKQQTGRSPWQYITERKLERARELLLATQLSVKEVACQLGFNTPDYFSRLFARHTGVTPSEYRGTRSRPR